MTRLADAKRRYRLAVKNAWLATDGAVAHFRMLEHKYMNMVSAEQHSFAMYRTEPVLSRF